MCGIAGYFSFNNKFSKEDLAAMTNALSRRGPDAEGFFANEFVGLGHRRLSILDLSTSANQPMTSSCGQYIMVYNGEVKNFKEIAHELCHTNPKLTLKTSSDTEVIIEAYAQWGEKFIEKLNGMFAIVIYNKQNDELFVARDRMGIKPIYYYKDEHNFIFASELKSFKQLKNKISLAINYSAVNEFLHLGYIPEPHSIYNSIHKFPSGKYLKVSKNNFEFTTYWNPLNKITKEYISVFSEAKQSLKSLVESSVKYRMISDVPFGTFLSGGIDSSLITAVAQKNSNKPVNTFSIGFKDSKHNEAGYAKKVADYLNTNHHEFTVTEKEAIDLVSTLPSIYDEPYADSSSIPTLLVSKLAKQYVTMTLAGDGGDELFMGYGTYKWAQRLSNPLVSALRKPTATAFSLLNSKYKRVSELINYADDKTKKSHVFSQEQYLFSRNEIKSLVNPVHYRDIILKENFNNLNRVLTAAEEQALFDLNYYLKDDLLVKVDRATMFYSLETRVPFLDYRIVEFALNLSPDLKIKNGVSKYLLKEVLYDYIPKAMFNRPKWGFSIPLQKWLKNELKFLTDTYLSDAIIRKHQVVNNEQVQILKTKFYSGNNDYLYNRIWLLIVLHQWLEDNC
jgi:asparagine synthase (glutamine-hydrolysing)